MLSLNSPSTIENKRQSLSPILVTPGLEGHYLGLKQGTSRFFAQGRNFEFKEGHPDFLQIT